MAGQQFAVSALFTANVSPFIASVGQASAATSRLAGDLDRANPALNRLEQNAVKAGKGMDGSIASMTKMGLGAAGLAIGLGAVVKSMSDFDTQMSKVKASTRATAQEMSQLRSAALTKDVAAMGFGASDAARGMNELAKAGIETKDILGGGLKGALSLAAAGEMEVGAAAETAAMAMAQFKLSGDKVSHVADLLAAGANNAQGEVKDMAMGLKQGGLVAAQTGLSIEETTGALTAFANAGLIGSDAGTSLKTMLLRLTPQSKEAQKAMDAMGFAAYDSNGKFIGLAAVAEKLKTGMADMSDQQKMATMNIIFGTDAIRAANVLYKEGAQGINSWIDKVNQSGYAAEQARIKQDNLQGDLKKLQSAFTNAAISQGGGLITMLRDFTQGATKLIDVAQGIPTPVLQGVAALVAMRVAGNLLGPSMTSATNSVGGFVQRVQTLGGMTTQVDSLTARWKALTDAQAPEKIAPSVQAMNNLQAAVAKNGPSFDTATAAGKRNTAALLEARNAAQQEIGTMIAAGATRQQVAAQAQQMVNSFNQIAPASRSASAAIAFQTTALQGIASAVGPAERGAFSLRTAWSNLGGASGLVKSGASSLLGVLGGPWGVAFMGAGLAVGALVNHLQAQKAAQEASAQGARDLAQTLDQTTGKYTQATAQMILQRQEATQLKDVTSQLGLSQRTVGEALLGNKAAQDQVNASLDQAIQKETIVRQTRTGAIRSLSEQGQAAQTAKDGFAKLNSELANSKPEWEKAKEAASGANKVVAESAVSTNLAAGALSQVGYSADKASGAYERIGSLTQTVVEKQKLLEAVAATTANQWDYAAAKLGNFTGSMQLSTEQMKQLDAQWKALTGSFSAVAAIDAADAAVQELGTKLKGSAGAMDQHTDAARKNRAAMQNAAEASMKAVKTYLEQGGAQDVASAKAEAFAQSIEATAKKSGIAADAVKFYTDKIRDIPKSASTILKVDADGALTALAQVQLRLDGINGRVARATVEVQENRRTNYSDGAGTGGYATGGAVFGPGTETSDSFLIRASNNEHMWDAQDVRGVGGHGNVYRLRAMASDGTLVKAMKAAGVPGFAKGGPVVGTPVSMSLGSAAQFAMRVSVSPVAIPVTFRWDTKELVKLNKELPSLLMGRDYSEGPAWLTKMRSGFTEIHDVLTKAVGDRESIVKKMEDAQKRIEDIQAKLAAAQAAGVAQQVKGLGAQAKSLADAQAKLAKAQNDLVKQRAQYQSAVAALNAAKTAKKKDPARIKAAELRVQAEQTDINQAQQKIAALKAQAQAFGRAGGNALVGAAQAGGQQYLQTVAKAQGNTKVQAFLQAALAQQGDSYVWGAHPSGKNANPNAFDCSGLVAWALQRAGSKYSADGTALTIGKRGKQISVDQAIKTPGALLYSGSHIAISLGNGKTIEAMGKKWGVTQGNAKGRSFTGGALIPDLFDGSAGPSGPLGVTDTGTGKTMTPLEHKKALNELAKSKGELTAAQRALKEYQVNAERLARVDKLLAASKGRMEELGAAVEKHKTAYEEAAAAAKQLREQFDAYAKQVKDQALSRGGINGLFKQGLADAKATNDELEKSLEWWRMAAALGNREAPGRLAEIQAKLNPANKAKSGYQGMVSGLQKAIAETTQFSQLVTRLKSMGLGESLLKQVIDAGVGEGNELGLAIEAQGVEGVKQLNNLQAELEAASNDLGQKSAESMYGAGTRTGEAFAQAMKEQFEKIEAEFKAFADRLQTQIGQIMSGAPGGGGGGGGAGGLGGSGSTGNKLAVAPPATKVGGAPTLSKPTLQQIANQLAAQQKIAPVGGATTAKRTADALAAAGYAPGTKLPSATTSTTKVVAAPITVKATGTTAAAASAAVSTAMKKAVLSYA